MSTKDFVWSESGRCLVWLHSPAVARGSSRKLHCPWKGPYRITRVITNVAYRVQQMRPPWRRIVVHCDHLKPYHGPRESSTPASPATVTPTDQPDLTPLDYEDEPVVYPSPPVQTSPELFANVIQNKKTSWSLWRLCCTLISPVDMWHLWGGGGCVTTLTVGIVSQPCLSMSHDLDCLAVISWTWPLFIM